MENISRSTTPPRMSCGIIECLPPQLQAVLRDIPLDMQSHSQKKWKYRKTHSNWARPRIVAAVCNLCITMHVEYGHVHRVLC